jgi:dihydroxyacetone kinase
VTSFINRPADFREDWTDGFVQAYSRYVERVVGASGVVRAGGARIGKVAVVIGGGSGHYPAFGGLVGAGLADAAVIGDVFTSPSSEQVQRVTRAADGGAGVLFSFGNYQGDVLNFGMAAEQLRNSGVDCRTVLVTDDVASAVESEKDARRGVAGTLLVFKIAGAAAESGLSINETERLARKANDRTRTLGVAFSACHLPGSRDQLFKIASDHFEVGLGIHGEPGIDSIGAVGPGDLAEIMLQPILNERPSIAGNRVAVVLNGLGGTKYEELFVLWKSLNSRMRRLDLELVLPEVGEYVTSLDTAGCSLTVCWLDDELESHWIAPVDTPSFRRGSFSPEASYEVRRRNEVETVFDGVDENPSNNEASEEFVASESGRRAAEVVREGLTAMLKAVISHETDLGRLDAVAGDGDHGTGMTRGFRAAVEAADRTPGGVNRVLASAGNAFGDRAGGTSGMIWAVLLGAVGDSLRGTDDPMPLDVAAAVAAGTEAVIRVGHVSVGDKTILDALAPFSEKLADRLHNGESLIDAWASASEAARAGATQTVHLIPRVGRARPLASRSLGSPDPGAVSFALCVSVAGEAFGVSANPRLAWNSDVSLHVIDASDHR